jgi:hypothetical protein
MFIYNYCRRWGSSVYIDARLWVGRKRSGFDSQKRLLSFPPGSNAYRGYLRFLVCFHACDLHTGKPFILSLLLRNKCLIQAYISIHDVSEASRMGSIVFGFQKVVQAMAHNAEECLSNPRHTKESCNTWQPFWPVDCYPLLYEPANVTISIRSGLKGPGQDRNNPL